VTGPIEPQHKLQNTNIPTHQTPLHKQAFVFAWTEKDPLAETRKLYRSQSDPIPILEENNVTDLSPYKTLKLSNIAHDFIQNQQK
jgi:hypothetical protein